MFHNDNGDFPRGLHKMTEEAQQSATPDVAEKPTLDSVISEFKAPAPQEKQTVQEFTPAQPQHIDPYDEDSLNKWASQTQQEQAALKSELQNLKAEAESRTQAESQKIIDAQIKSAVKVISDGIEGLDPLAAEFILEKTARENENFKHLFHNQEGNEELYQKALSAIISENEGKFKRVDTQIAENHRAAQQSQQSNNTQKATEYGNPLEEALANAKSEGERRAIWSNAKNLGY